MVKTAFLGLGVGIAFLILLFAAWALFIHYQPAPSSTPDLQYFLRFHGQQLVSVALPPGWGMTTQTGQSGYTATYAAPSGSQDASLAIEAWAGANHNATNGSGVFDPAAALSSGCALDGQTQDVYTFSCSGGYEHGALYTTPNIDGSIVLTVQSAQSSVWQNAIHSFTVQAPVANHLLSGQP